MSTVTYKNQPAIHKTRGAIPLEGTTHLYTISKKLWPDEVEEVLERLLIGESLHMCCGMSQLGDVRLDLDPAHEPDLIRDAQDTGLADKSFDTVLIDMPYNGKFQWMHNVLSELSRIARERIIFQQWYIPANKHGRYKKDNSFMLTKLYCWQPQTYFGRAHIISVFDFDKEWIK